MPDNKKQGRSNKAMTFFVCFPRRPGWITFWPGYRCYCRCFTLHHRRVPDYAHTQEWVVSSMMFGAAVGAVGSGWLSFKLGVKRA
jgi:SP family galactose:H+ symporter-like MFS transporter